MPKYRELVECIKEQMAAKKLLPGQKMYSEYEMMEVFGVSRQTVRHAMEVLAQEGLIHRVQGSGTYISEECFLKLEKPAKVMIVANDVDNDCFQGTLQGIKQVLSEQGYFIQVGITNNQHDREKEILKDIVSSNEVAGILVEPTKSGVPNPNLCLYKELHKRKMPILFVNGYYSDLKIPHVSMNDYMAAKRATEHLIEMGHKRIGGIFKLDDIQGYKRYAGFIEAMQAAELEVQDSRILWMDTEDMKTLSKCTERILDRMESCTGIFCYNDQIAFKVIELLKNEGFFVPEDISFVSVDNSEWAVKGEVSLSTIPHPMERLGKMAAENLVKLIMDSKFDGTYEFDDAIIVRDSVRKL